MDPIRFTALFRKRKKNHAAICIELQSLVAGVAARYWFGPTLMRSEATANMLLACIERIDRFRFNKGSNAFAYYSRVAICSLLRQFRDLGNKSSRVELFTDIDHDFSSSRSSGGDTDFDGDASPIERAVSYVRLV